MALDPANIPGGQCLSGDVPFSDGTDCPEAACVRAPEALEHHYREAIRGGADVIGTNTLNANAAFLASHGLEGHTNELNWLGAQIARAATKGTNATVAGRIGGMLDEIPAEQREELLREQVGAILDGGIRLIVFQKFQTLPDLLMALEVKQSLHHCPAICHVPSDAAGLLPDGTSVRDALSALENAGAEALGIEADLDAFPTPEAWMEEFDSLLVSATCACPAWDAGRVENARARMRDFGFRMLLPLRS